MVVLAVVLLCFCFLASAIPKTEAATETPKTLTNNGTMRYYYYDAAGQQFWTESGSFTVDGSITAICCEHNKSQPYTQTVYESVIENADLAKILYYGTIKEVRWGGFETEEHAIVVTSLLVDAVYNGTTPKGITKGFREWLDTQPPAPTPYIFFYRTSSTSYQDLIGYNPKFEQGTISVQKTDPSGKSLAGARFKAVNQETGLILPIGPTDSTGYASTGTVVPYGTYTVTEITAPAGYIKSDETWTVKVSPDNNGAVKFTAVNEPEFGKAQIIKMSTDGNISGIEFTLTGENLTAPLKGKTDSNGFLTFTDLKPGTYTVTETVPNKYQPQESQTVTVLAEETATVIFFNKVKLGSVKGLKVNGAHEPLSDAVIGLFNVDETEFTSDTALKTVRTGADGVFEFKNIPYGKYIVREIEAPSGYFLNSTRYSVNIQNHGDVIELEIVNNQEEGLIIVLKESEDGNISGIEFTLTGGNLKTPIKGVTNSEGVTYFSNLMPGTYTVTENIPVQYQVQASQNVTVIKNKTVFIGFLNELKKGSVKGLKVNPNKEPLSGSVIGLFNVDETEFTLSTALRSVTTGVNGAFEFNNIPYGEYVVKEIKSPTGYILNNTTYPVKIENHGDIIELEIVNDFILKSIEILKTDTYTNPLGGAIFTLETSSDGGETWEIISDLQTQENGIVIFENLLPGVFYRVTETKAPDGFQLLSAPVFQGTLDVSDETKITYTVVNAPIYELPATGGNSFILVTASITTTLLLCTFFFLKKSKVSKYKNI